MWERLSMSGADLNSQQTELKWTIIKQRGSMICSHCRIEKPLTHFRPYKNKCNRQYTSYSNSCFECNKTRHKKCERKTSTRIDQKLGQLLSGARARSIRDNKVFNLTKQFLIDLFNKQEGKCFYTGLDLLAYNNSSNDLCVSIDRINSTKDYTTDNVVFCCWIINRIKTDLSIKDFVNYCSLIVNNKNKLI
jgi:hypothetical protein